MEPQPYLCTCCTDGDAVLKQDCCANPNLAHFEARQIERHAYPQKIEHIERRQRRNREETQDAKDALLSFTTLRYMQLRQANFFDDYVLGGSSCAQAEERMAAVQKN